MEQNWIATATIDVDAGRDRVWQALVDPAAIKQYMFGSTVVTDWRIGGPIIWKGEWQGKPFEDKGKILQLVPGRLLQYSHFSPLSGVPDEPENYHTVTVELSGDGNRTRVVLSQDGNGSEEERDHSAKNWEMMLQSLKAHVEQGK